mmetsp:Transcript_31100/g.87167  ORF Transcript_31100/g.87167 Transcript_31100/m.87167 type:complete len:486 (-) Transcript_31100:130-1587(-)|eukprot:CAMPEP_0119120078 /NCGR_PEP_ID=MMETSP1310-20130426/1281_1 /TAXON_ID=464262 /ORGANISM="Genus nov. species nov., Strain RCC2339" /LENGTH=485 /DNA_ID=CAMNT_0007109541 /DNA_START=37 /DNA_END=1494 /DNA_ORIENTATION=+
MAKDLNVEEARAYVEKKWEDEVTPKLMEYISIPNVSPAFDPEVHTNGLQEKAMDLIFAWMKANLGCIPGAKPTMHHENGKTPLITVEIPAFDGSSERPEEQDTVLMYGHADKQPPFEGWNEGLGPYTPVIRDGKLYGRGGADDGYSAFSALLAVHVLRRQGLPHKRIVILIEASEESGSVDLPFYINHLKDLIGTPSLVVCLDSGSGNYEQLWITNSLRGIVVGDLCVQVIGEGVHSGNASGVVPGSFRIVRQLLDRVEDSKTGRIICPGIEPTKLSDHRRAAVAAAAKALGREGIIEAFPFHGSTQPAGSDLEELLVQRWWSPQLAIVGCDGMPECQTAGNVLRPLTRVTLSLRIAPDADCNQCEQALKNELERDPPLGATVTFTPRKSGAGWAAPQTPAWLEQAFQDASQAFFEKPAMHLSEGGSIPLIYNLGQLFPKSSFCVTGVLGPASNAHGPNEFIHLSFAKRLTCCISVILLRHNLNA